MPTAQECHIIMAIAWLSTAMSGANAPTSIPKAEEVRARPGLRGAPILMILAAGARRSQTKLAMRAETDELQACIVWLPVN